MIFLNSIYIVELNNANSLLNIYQLSLEVLKKGIDYDYSLKHILDKHHANMEGN